MPLQLRDKSHPYYGISPYSNVTIKAVAPKMHSGGSLVKGGGRNTWETQLPLYLNHSTTELVNKLQKLLKERKKGIDPADIENKLVNLAQGIKDNTEKISAVIGILQVRGDFTRDVKDLVTALTNVGDTARYTGLWYLTTRDILSKRPKLNNWLRDHKVADPRNPGEFMQFPNNLEASRPTAVVRPQTGTVLPSAPPMSRPPVAQTGFPLGRGRGRPRK